MHRSTFRVLLMLSVFVVAVTAGAEEPYAARTTARPEINPAAIEVLLRPLTKSQLEVEAAAWMELLQDKATEIANVEIAIKLKNLDIGAAEGEKATLPEATDVVAETPAPTETAATDAEAADVSGEIKGTLLTSLTMLREQRTALIDRTDLVLGALEAKGGDVTEQRLYVAAVSGMVIDVTDTRAAMATVVGWLKSREGGLRWAGNLAQFAGIVFAAWLLSLFLGAIAERAMNRAMRTSQRMSSLMRDFISKSIRRIVLVIGVVVALSALEVEIGPLLAVIAGAGFVVAFALQDSLSNLASGIMILMYRPFDVGDVVDVADVSGTVKSMNLVSTTITTFDNKVVIVPNNSVWRNVITNATGSRTRRVDLVFGIGYESDIGTAKSIMEKIVTDHPAVLDDPEPNIQVHELADSSVNFICRPWVKTDDYWAVYWDVTRTVKEEFDKAGVSIPFPQRDVHVHHANASAEPPVTEVSPAAGEHVVS